MLITDSRRLRFFNFAIIYAWQGLIAGFSTTVVFNVFAANGLSVAELGRYFAIIGMPWIFQFAWGPLVDGFPNFFMGKRRFWIFVSLILSNLTLASLLFLPDIGHNLTSMSVIFFVYGLTGSLLYVATDGLIVDHTPDEDAGKNSAVTRGGFLTGTALAAAGFSWTLKHWGYHPTIFLLLGSSLLMALVPLLVRESRDDKWISFSRKFMREKKVRSARKTSEMTKRLIHMVYVKLVCAASLSVLGLGFILNYCFSATELSFLTKSVQLHYWSDVELSQSQALIGWLNGTVGALLIGGLVNRVGCRRVLVGLISMSALFFAALAIAGGGGLGTTTTEALHMLRWPTLILITCLPGAIFVAMVPPALETSRGLASATRFTLCMTCMNVGDLMGSASSGWIHDLFSDANLSWISAGLVFACLAILHYLPDPQGDKADQDAQLADSCPAPSSGVVSGSVPSHVAPVTQLQVTSA